MSGLKSLFNKLLGNKMSESSEQHNPCTGCAHEQACSISAMDCRYDQLKKEFAKFQEEAAVQISALTIKNDVDDNVLIDMAYREGYLKALKEFAYWKGGCEYVGHKKPRKLSDVLEDIESGKHKIK